MKFRFEHRIQTLAKNAVAPTYSSFEEGGIKFSQWDFNMREGWFGTEAWLAEGEAVADNLTDAVNKFTDNLLHTCRRIAFISQSYTEAWSQPWVATRSDSEIGFFRYTQERAGGGLMFSESDLRALKTLKKSESIQEEFYYYWGDAQITYGYVAKLLLMFSALEALSKKKNKENDYAKLEQILGKKLKETIFGTKGDSSNALRNRLVHGEYLSGEDSSTNYLELIHRAVLTHFNEKILGQRILNVDVVNPQRHFFGNRNECRIYLEPKPGSKMGLKEILADFDSKGVHHFEKYDAVWDKARQEAFLGQKIEM